MMAMADMIVVVVVGNFIALLGERMVVLGMRRAGVQIMIVKMHPDRVLFTARMNMHPHRRRPGKLERNNQQKDKCDQAAHALNATPARAPNKPRRAANAAGFRGAPEYSPLLAVRAALVRV